MSPCKTEELAYYCSLFCTKAFVKIYISKQSESCTIHNLWSCSHLLKSQRTQGSLELTWCLSLSQVTTLYGYKNIYLKQKESQE